MSTPGMNKITESSTASSRRLGSRSLAAASRWVQYTRLAHRASRKVAPQTVSAVARVCNVFASIRVNYMDSAKTRLRFSIPTSALTLATYSVMVAIKIMRVRAQYCEAFARKVTTVQVGRWRRYAKVRVGWMAVSAPAEAASTTAPAVATAATQVTLVKRHAGGSWPTSGS